MPRTLKTKTHANWHQSPSEVATQHSTVLRTEVQKIQRREQKSKRLLILEEMELEDRHIRKENLTGDSNTKQGNLSNS